MLKVNHTLFTNFKYINNLHSQAQTNEIYYEETIIKNDYPLTRLCAFNVENKTIKEYLPYQEKLTYFFYQNKPHLIEDNNFFAFRLLYPIVDLLNIDEQHFLLRLEIDTGSQIEKNIFSFSYYPIYNKNNKFLTTYKRLYLYNLKTNELKPLSEEYLNVTKYTYKQNKVLFAGYNLKFDISLKEDIYEFSLVNFSVKKLNKEKLFVHDLFYLLDKPYILASSNYEETTALYTYLNKHLHLLYKTSLYFGNTVFFDFCSTTKTKCFTNNDKYYFIATANSGANIYEITPKEIKPLTELNASFLSACFLNNKLYFSAFLNEEGPELYTYNNKQSIALTANNKNFLSQYYLAPFLKQKETDSWILLPKNFSEKESCPAILCINDSPLATYAPIFNNMLQYLVNEDFIVIAANIYSKDTDLNTFKWGEEDFEKALTILRKARERYPNIDYKRIGVIGSNYGGFLSAWLISHSNLFACCAIYQGINNWFSYLYSASNSLKLISNQNLINDKILPQKLLEISPLKYVDNIKTPTLLVQNTSSLNQAIELYIALKWRRIETKLLILNQENSDLNNDIKNYQYYLQEIKVWFVQHLFNRN